MHTVTEVLCSKKNHDFLLVADSGICSGGKLTKYLHKRSYVAYCQISDFSHKVVILFSALLSINPGQGQDPWDSWDSGQKARHALGRAQYETMPDAEHIS